jgi:deoxycytidylate deaminase
MSDENSSDGADTTQSEPPAFLGQKFAESELVVALVGAVGTELHLVTRILSERLKAFQYHVEEIRVSGEIIPQLVTVPEHPADEYSRIDTLMSAGDEARRSAQDNSVLALGVAARIASKRVEEGGRPPYRARSAYLVNSLKHPEEVARLREIYPEGFFLLGVHAGEEHRRKYLVEEKRLTPEQANKLMRRDENENILHGQRTSDTFHLSDFFLRTDEHQDKLRNSVWRILDILFGHPYKTPIFGEFAMFMAFAASLRSADLSRQVGAVVAVKEEIIATGANDCPRCGGGLYWPKYSEESRSIEDAPRGRDYTRGHDANELERERIIQDILQRAGDCADKEALRRALEESRIMDITEYGRVVHAEMEALLACARNHGHTRGATLYSTTFPCHNCAKHIIAAGIVRVVYIEPYPKSKTAEFHDDSIFLGFSDGPDGADRVRFEPFVGVGPRRFFDLFSMRLGAGFPLRRKDSSGHVLPWRPETSKLRIQMLPASYLDLEKLAANLFNTFKKKNGGAS